MILLDDFFSLVALEHNDGYVVARIAFRPDHPVYKGHFPGNPVVPGVCMLQIVLEIMNRVIGKKIHVLSADSLKFLSSIDPRINSELDVRIDYLADASSYHLTAVMFDGPIIFFKLKVIVRP